MQFFSIGSHISGAVDEDLPLVLLACRGCWPRGLDMALIKFFRQECILRQEYLIPTFDFPAFPSHHAGKSLHEIAEGLGRYELLSRK
jgi:hypothetical protein